MFDVNKTLTIIKGGLFEPGATWKAYLDEDHDWKETLTLVAGPVIVISAIFGALFSWIFSSHSMLAQRTGFWGLLLGIIAAAIGLLVTAFIFSFFAGVFKGTSNFNKGLAALALAAIPAYVGGIIISLPWIGWLFALALSIVSLVFLYKIIPIYLEVPEDKRVVHYAASLVASFVIVFVINVTIGLGAHSTGGMGKDDMHGMPGEIGRHAELMEKSEQDVYEPPSDGKISKAQMVAFVDVMRKSAELRKRAEEKIKRMEKDMEGKDKPGLSDIGKLTSGFGAVFSALATAEMEVVESSDGNWAEHQWVKKQLRTAVIQQDLNDAVKHNYELYQEYEDRLNEYGAF